MADKELLNGMIDAARQGGDIASAYFRSGIEADAKELGAPVTIADRESEGKCREILSVHFPGYAIVGEEGTEKTLPENAKEGDRCFAIDPIDGTKNFARGDRMFSTSIALMEYQKGQWNSIAAVVYAPELDKQCYVAEKNKGAFLVDGDGKRVRLQARTARALEPGKLGAVALSDIVENTLVEINPVGRDIPTLTYRLDEKLRTSGAGPRMTGSPALTLAMIADGSRDGAIYRIRNPWDTAAGELIAAEAGAIIKSYDLRTAENPDLRVAAANSQLHLALDRVMQDAIKVADLAAPNVSGRKI